jgi:hypothetical protein
MICRTVAAVPDETEMIMEGVSFAALALIRGFRPI